MTTRPVWILLAVSALGCGSARLMLKPPLEAQCAGAGLKGCPELADAAIAYVEGDTDAGTAAAVKAGAANSPAELRAFAQTVDQLGSVPGVGDYVQPLKELLDKVVAASESAANAKSGDAPELAERGGTSAATAASQPGAAPSNASGPSLARAEAPPADFNPRFIVTQTTDPSRFKQSAACDDGFQCVRVTIGPIVVTDAMAAAGCEASRLVALDPLESDLRASRWRVPVGDGFHGARLMVRDMEALVVVTPKDSACEVTWSGVRLTAFSQ